MYTFQSRICVYNNQVTLKWHSELKETLTFTPSLTGKEPCPIFYIWPRSSSENAYPILTHLSSLQQCHPKAYIPNLHSLSHGIMPIFFFELLFLNLLFWMVLYIWLYVLFFFPSLLRTPRGYSQFFPSPFIYF